MQKPPKFGEKSSEYNESREKSVLGLYKAFICQPSGKNVSTSCEEIENSTVFNILNDKQGLHTKYGIKTATKHFISAEEAFFLACRKLIKYNPVDILKNSETFIHKILIYSFLKRKGVKLSIKDTSLALALQSKHLINSKKLKDSKEYLIKNPDDPFEYLPGEFYVNCDFSYEKIKIEAWDFK